jgi:hypothetical protein
MNDLNIIKTINNNQIIINPSHPPGETILIGDLHNETK